MTANEDGLGTTQPHPNEVVTTTLKHKATSTNVPPDTSPTPVDTGALRKAVARAIGDWRCANALATIEGCTEDNSPLLQRVLRAEADQFAGPAVDAMLAELRSARAAIGPDSERIRELEAEVQRLRGVALHWRGEALAPGKLLLGPDKVAVDREALRHVLRYGFGHGPCQICTSVSAALSEPQPKPEGTS